jgi:hypothetical protein
LVLLCSTLCKTAARMQSAETGVHGCSLVDGNRDPDTEAVKPWDDSLG